MKKDDLLTQIAQEQCRIETLEIRNSDGLDFHDVSVWSLKAALERAFDAGMEQGQQQTMPPALFELNRRLTDLANHAAEECERRLEQDDRAELPLADLSHRYDLELYDNKTLWDTATAMIAERLDDPKLEFEIDKNELIITRAPEMEMGMGM